MSEDDAEKVCHCEGRCGRYVLLSKAVMAPENGGWHVAGHWTAPVFTCPGCFRSSVKAKLRATVMGGKPVAEWTPDEREEASQMLGRDLSNSLPKEPDSE